MIRKKLSDSRSICYEAATTDDEKNDCSKEAKEVFIDLGGKESDFKKEEKKSIQD